MRLTKVPDYVRAFVARRRDPRWAILQAQFGFDADRVLAMQRLTRTWTDNLGLRPVDVFKGAIAEEVWSPSHIGDVVERMARTHHRSGAANRMRTSDLPRFLDYPLVVVRTQGTEFLIDGRRRANLWCRDAIDRAVRVIRVEPSAG